MTVQSHNLNKHFSPVNLNVERKGHGEMAAPLSLQGPRGAYELALGSIFLFLQLLVSFSSFYLQDLDE